MNSPTAAPGLEATPIRELTSFGEPPPDSPEPAFICGLNQPTHMTSSSSNQGDAETKEEAVNEGVSDGTTRQDARLSGNYSCCSGFAYYSKRMQEEGRVPVSSQAEMGPPPMHAWAAWVMIDETYHRNLMTSTHGVWPRTCTKSYVPDCRTIPMPPTPCTCTHSCALACATPSLAS